MTDTLALDVTRVEQSRLAEVDFEQLKFGHTFTDHMYMADYRDGKWGQARIVPYGNLQLSPATSGLHYGQSIFEGMKAYRLESGEICIWRPMENFERMNRSAERMCMPTLPEEIFMQGLQHLIALDSEWVPRIQGGALYIRPFMFATDPLVGVRPSDTYSFIIFCSPAGVYYNAPLKVKVERHYSRSVRGGTGFAKNAGNYANAMYPTLLANREGFNQLIWTDAIEHKYIEESGTMNVMFIINGTLVTAPVSDTILKGVTRDSILTLARESGVPVEERKITVDELEEALKAGTLNDAFGVGTAATFAPFKQIDIDGVLYDLPEPSATSLDLRKQMEDIRTGKVADTRGWLFKV